MLRNTSLKKLALLLAVAVIGAAAGAGVTYHFTKDNGAAKPEVEKTVAPPQSISPDKSKENAQVPVATIGNEYKSYLGLKVTALGKIEKTTDNPSRYILVSNDGKASLLIDTSALNGKQSNYIGQQVKLTGTIKFLDLGNGHFTLGIQASSIST